MQRLVQCVVWVRRVAHFRRGLCWWGWLLGSGCRVHPRCSGVGTAALGRIRLLSLRFASLANLGLETCLDGIDRPSRTTRLARHEEDTVFLCKQRVWRFARLASDVFDCEMEIVSAQMMMR